MGTTQHNAVVATTFNLQSVLDIKHWISQLCQDDQKLFLIGPLVENGFKTIVMVPDGIKEYRPGSDRFDEIRNLFINELWSGMWHYVDVSFGENGSEIQKTNCYNNHPEDYEKETSGNIFSLTSRMP